MIALSLFSLAYFGFYRQGCICAIGSIQNVTLALFNSSYTVPITALVFLLAPLAVALFAGRAFCAAVCPQGAIQDVVLLKPVKVPAWLEHALGLLPFIFLGAGVLFAATGSAFVICRYDPFIPIFRMSGSFPLLALGAGFLIVGMFVGRPYCRFLCPYGALLKLAGAVSKWRVRVTPSDCAQCTVCEDACPFGAIREPSAVSSPASGRSPLVLLILLALVLIAGLGWTGSLLGTSASKLHPSVVLAEHYFANIKKPAPYTPQTPEALLLKRAEKDPRAVATNAASVRARFVLGGWLLGGWIGLVIGVKLISLSVRHLHSEFEPDRGACVSCARCFEYCPKELLLRKRQTASLEKCEKCEQYVPKT